MIIHVQMLVKESPMSDEWKKKLLSLKCGDVFLNKFSPTGFYSSAVRNEFIKQLRERNARQIAFEVKLLKRSVELSVGSRGKKVYVSPNDKKLSEDSISMGYTDALVILVNIKV